MALSTKQQQQKKLKRQEKRKQQLQRKIIPTLAIHECPIEMAVVYERLWDDGIGPVAIIRRASNGKLYMGNFLLDVWYLGVKDVFVRSISREEMSHYFSQHPTQNYSPEYCKSLILAAERYGAENGFKANIDAVARRFIRNIREEPGQHSFQFGKDGAPFYVEGPYDQELLPELMGDR